MPDIVTREDLRVRRPPQLSEMAYDKIKFMIISLQLAPGTPVILEHLVSQLGVSRTPIRDAIVRLQGDGFVEVDGEAGTYVAPVTAERIVELYQVREPLECLAVRLATPHIADTVLHDVGQMFETVESDIQAGDYERYFSADTAFHQAILEAANNRWLRRMLQPLAEHAYRVRQLAKSRRGPHIYASHQEHCQILTAMQARNVETAEQLMARHISGTADRLAKIMEHLMRITIGADHAGFELKEYLRKFLAEQGHTVEDAGCYDLNMVDYPDQAASVGHGVAEGRADAGVLVCGTGLGMSIAANKVHGVRAARVTDPMSARLAREHNDANVLCLGAWMVGTKLAEEIVSAWLAAHYAQGRHEPRLKKIASLEKEG